MTVNPSVIEFTVLGPASVTMDVVISINPSVIEFIVLAPASVTKDIGASVSSTLAPSQSTGGVKPKIISTLEPEQIIRPNIVHSNVESVLEPEQQLRPNIVSTEIESTLVPEQEIVVDDSEVSYAPQSIMDISLGISFTDGGDFTKPVQNALEPEQGSSNYVIPYVTRAGGIRYRADDTKD